MRHFAYSLLSAALLTLTPVAANANLLNDPGFELATGGGQTSNSNWTLTADMPAGAAAQFQDATWASNPLGDPGIGVWFKAFEGDDTVGANATLEQTVAAGPGVYDLSFWVRHEANFAADSASVILSSDQGDTATFDILSSTPNDGEFNQFSIEGFVASPGATSLTVQAVMINGVDAGANPQSLMIDDFSLTAVPEPCAAALAVVGLAGLWRRRR